MMILSNSVSPLIPEELYQFLLIIHVNIGVLTGHVIVSVVKNTFEKYLSNYSSSLKIKHLKYYPNTINKSI